MKRPVVGRVVRPVAGSGAAGSGAESRSTALRRRLAIAFLAVAVPAGAVVLGQPLWWYATGTPAKATVRECHDPGRKPLVCNGTWTLPDGGEHHGRIAGAGRGDIGKTVGVRATTSHAATFTLRLVYAPVLVLLVAGLLACGGYRQRARAPKRPRRDARPAGPGGGADPSS